MRTVSFLGFVLLCLAGSACGAKVVVDAPFEGEGGGGAVSCTPGEQEPCFDGPPEKLGVGVCKSGVRACTDSGTFGECNGDVTPQKDTCGNGLDEDCNGVPDDDPSCMVPCLGCAEFVSEPTPSLPLCEGESQIVHKNLIGCICSGTCAVSCTANFCVGSAPSDTCLDCVVSPSGCGEQFNACAIDS